MHSIRKLGMMLLALGAVLSWPIAGAANPARKKTHRRAPSPSVSRAAATSPKYRQVTRFRSNKARKGKKTQVAAVSRGQRGIDGDRAREIQAALIREKYLDGEPSGIWDQASRSAMTRFQNDNGWQTKIVPDSRALIKLGLGPNHAGLLNPSSDPAVLLPDSARGMRPGGADSR